MAMELLDSGSRLRLSTLPRPCFLPSRICLGEDDKGPVHCRNDEMHENKKLDYARTVHTVVRCKAQNDSPVDERNPQGDEMTLVAGCGTEVGSNQRCSNIQIYLVVN